jgi:integrase
MVSILQEILPATAATLKRREIPLTRPAPPTQQEFARLVDEAEKLARSHAREVIEFLAHTGLRISGAQNVRWTDVYEDRIEYIAKGGRRCSVPIINGLRDVLARLKTIDDGREYVLPRGTVKKGLRMACERAGLRRLTHHDFRHMFITRCIESGVDIPTIARWVGHKDGGALLSKRYFHLLDDHSRMMAQRVKI